MQTEAVNRPAPFWLRYVFGRNPAWTVARILFVVLSVLVVFKFVLLPIKVTGDSMYPTYPDGKIKFVNKLAYIKAVPQRGDVVAVEFAGREILLLKRIIAVPGDVFEVRRGDVYINGERLDEPYANGKITTLKGNRLGHSNPIPLEEGEYLVIGDNRNITDGYIQKEREILGKVL